MEGEKSGGSKRAAWRAPAGLAGAAGAVVAMGRGRARDEVVEVLEADGWSVHLADDGWALLDLLSHAAASSTARAPRLALIARSVGGPDLRQLAARALALAPTLPIVWLARDASPEEVRVDPLDPAALRSAIDRAVRSDGDAS